MEWSLPAVQDAIAAAVPERDMLVLGKVRRRCHEVRRRTGGRRGPSGPPPCYDQSLHPAEEEAP